jgi:hypothetical protein
VCFEANIATYVTFIHQYDHIIADTVTVVLLPLIIIAPLLVHALEKGIIADSTHSYLVKPLASFTAFTSLTPLQATTPWKTTTRLLGFFFQF